MNYVDIVKEDLSKRIDVEPQLLDLYTLLVFTRGIFVTWEDVHDAWSIYETNTNSCHKSIVPFDRLSKETQELDSNYAQAIKETATALNPRQVTF